MKTPKWDGSRWRIREMREGKMHSFSSSVPGVKGRKEVIKKYEQWYYGDASGEKTVAQVTKEYLADVKARCGEFSPALEQYECYSRLYIVPACGQEKICKMTLRDWQSVINEARGQRKPLSEKTLRNLRALIMSIIKFGYEDYQCEMPRGELYIPKGHSKKEKEILQKDDIRRLLEPSKLFYHPLFTFLLVTGMRPSEALGLKAVVFGQVFRQLAAEKGLTLVELGTLAENDPQIDADIDAKIVETAAGQAKRHEKALGKAQSRT